MLQLEIGAAVLRGRSSGLSWKTLEDVYGRSRAQLRRYAMAVLTEPSTGTTGHNPECRDL